MKKDRSGQLLYSPSDLVRYLASPFASWMDRYFLQHPDAVTPDETSAEDKLIAETGQAHERTVLADLERYRKAYDARPWSCQMAPTLTSAYLPGLHPIR